MAIINITAFSGPLTAESNVEPTWAEPNSSGGIATPSANTRTGGSGTITGRSDQLHNIFPASAVALTSYNPRDTYITLMGGADSTLALGSTVSDGAGQYFGSSVTTSHLTYADAPNLTEVSTSELNIPNPYTPDVSAGNGDSADYAAEFNTKYPGGRNSFPPDGAVPGTPLSPVPTTDLNATAIDSTSTLSPHTTSTRTGGWFTDTTLNWGRWNSD